MLYMAGGGRITRVHGAFVSDEEVEIVAQFLRDQGAPVYVESVTGGEGLGAAPAPAGNGRGRDERLYEQAAALNVLTTTVQ
jgi:S-DNA-T family DNA segregation ATPase FtsK/SpoIIIE